MTYDEPNMFYSRDITNMYTYYALLILNIMYLIVCGYYEHCDVVSRCISVANNL